MSLILNIDTSEQIATVSIAENGLIFALQKNETQNKHAAFLHTAIKSLLDNLPNQKINAVAVVAGPGSYRKGCLFMPHDRCKENGGFYCSIQPFT